MCLDYTREHDSNPCSWLCPPLQMEEMEVDSPVNLRGEGSTQPAVNAAAAAQVISDSGSSTEVDEDDDDDRGRGQRAARAPPTLPATWAFMRRAVMAGAAATQSAAQGAPIRRRLR